LRPKPSFFLFFGDWPSPVTSTNQWPGWVVGTHELIQVCATHCEGNNSPSHSAKTENCESGAKERRTYLETKPNALVCWLIICFTLCVLFSSSSSRVLSFCLCYSVLVPVFFFFSVFLSLCSLHSSVFFPLSYLQFLLSSSSGFYPFRLCPLVSVLGSFCVSVFSLFFVRGFLFFLCYLWFLASPVRSLGFYPLSSPGFSLQFSGPPFYCLCSVLLFSWYSLVPPQVFLCYFCLSLFRLFFCVSSQSSFFFIPLCASPVFSLFGWFASAFTLKRFPRNKVMNSCFLNGAVFLTKMAILQLCPWIKNNWTPLFRCSLQQGPFILFSCNLDPNQLQTLVIFQLSPWFP